MQMALRGLRQELKQRNLLVVLFGIALVLGVSGPFGTFEHFSLELRLAYWLIVVFVTFCIGTITTGALRHALSGYPTALVIFITGLILTLIVTLFVMFANGVVLSSWPREPADFLRQLLAVGPICFVTVVGEAMMRGKTAPLQATPDILARLPIEKRGALVALSVSDHYVKVTTRNGSEMVLMRLSDAIKETQPTAGLQVHRSHWIATREVSSVQRISDRAECTMKTGDIIPVSRSYIRAIREAGLLPKMSNG